MYIYKIIIENFRNFENFSWKPNKEVNVLFGPNGCGKTNLAEALMLVFSSSNYDVPFSLSDYYLGDDSRHIRIQVWLDDVIDSLNTRISECLQHIDKNDNFVDDDTYENTKAVLIYQLESSTDHKMEWSFFQQTQHPDCQPYARRAIDFTYIDADRQPLKEIGLQQKSTFYQMSKDIIGEEIEKISKELTEIADRKLTESQVINGYMENLLKLGKLSLIEQYRLLLKNPDSTWNTSGYELGTVLGNTSLPFNKHSKGVQNLFLLLMMKNKLDGSGIVFIEELEQNLEPKHQKYITDEYKQLQAGQIFITSHSPEIISHFDYENVYTVQQTAARHLLEGLSTGLIKEIYRANKKEFISALMASNVLLVEGSSEYESFPLYSYNDNLAFSEHDVEIIEVGGKSKFLEYCKAFKHFKKKVYVVIDNDPDVKRTINDLSKIADIVFVSQNDYEDLIFPYMENIKNELDELVAFSAIRNKLVSINNKEVEKLEKKEQIAVKKYIVDTGLDINAIDSYEDLITHPILMKYTLHNSFSSPYYSRAIGRAIIEHGITPYCFECIRKHISGEEDILKTYSDDMPNVLLLVGDGNGH